MQVKMYICPVEGCGNYYGSSSQQHLHDIVVGQHDANFTRKPEESWFSRAHCPDCRSRGVRTVRVLVVADVDAATQRAVATA